MENLLTSDQLASLLHIEPATAEKWRMNGRGPSFIRAEGRILYRPEDVDAFLKSRTVRHSQEIGLIRDRGERMRRWRGIKRVAEVLGCTLVDGKPQITVAAFRTRPGKMARGFGQLTFICPICGDQHFHGANGPEFGSTDGSHYADCAIDNFLNAAGYRLEEVREPYRAGSLPREDTSPAIFPEDFPADAGTGEAA